MTQPNDPTYAALDADPTASPDGATAPTSQQGDGDGDARRELEEQRDKYLRLAAEYDNYRRRSTKERQDAGARAQADVVKQLIESLDDLARFAHLDPSTVDAATVVQGAEMVEKKMLKVFGALGLEVVNPIGEQFDPATQEAVTLEPAATPEEDHTVARVFQSAYVFNGQLLRPARVVVRQWNG